MAMESSHLGRAPSMGWLPPATNFRADVEAALALTNPTEALGRLIAVAQHRLSFLETIQLDRALAQLGDVATSVLPTVRLAVLGSATLDHLAPAIRVAGLRHRLAIRVHVGAYGQFRQELFDTGSALHQFAPEIVLFSLAARDAVGDLPLTGSAGEAENAINRAVGDLRALWQRVHNAFNATVIQQSFLDTSEALFGSYDRLVPAAPTRVIALLNDRIADAARSDGALWLDVTRAGQRDGIDAWFDTTRWLQAKMEIAPQAAPRYGELAARIVAAQRGLSKKCLVLDLDNTLWGGEVGDDGIEGIKLGQGSAVGEAYLALQRYAKQLSIRGVILAVCSKNDPTIAETAFNQHPEMILRRSDIAAFVANWNDKVENLKAIAARLNIGINSLVFLDDNPAERARVRSSLPMVAVPELPEDPAHYVRCLADAGYFEAVSFTPEDRVRTAQYVANAEREALLSVSQSMNDFLRGLEMTVVFGPLSPADLARVTQLINKTNQFNPTARRYTAEQIGAAATAPECITLQFRLLDRFGDNGLVSAMILRAASDEPNVFDIECWVMSCRVFGRRLEFEAMNIAVETARRRGVLAIRADYIPTAKNRVVAELFPSLGFVRVDQSGQTAGAARWSLTLNRYNQSPTDIVRKAR